MSLANEINEIHELAVKFFGDYTATHYVNGDDDATVQQKKARCAQKNEWITAKIQEKVTETMTTLVDLTNGLGNDALVPAMVDGIHRSHRALQHEFIVNYLPEFLKIYGDSNDEIRDRTSDPRNHHAKNMAERMAASLNL
jgi:hypothetical protein